MPPKKSKKPQAVIIVKKKRKQPKKKHVADLSGPTGVGFAHLAKIKFFYNRYVSLTDTATSSYQYEFYLNSAYDFDKTGVGDSVPLLQNIMLIWDKYRVTYCKLKITLTNLASVRTNAGFVANGEDIPAADIYGNTSYQTDLPNQKFTELAPAGQDGSTKTLRFNVSMANIVGKQYFYNSGYWGVGSASPAAFVYGSLMGQTIDSTTVMNVSATVQAVLYTELYGQDFTVANEND